MVWTNAPDTVIPVMSAFEPVTASEILLIKLLVMEEAEIEAIPAYKVDPELAFAEVLIFCIVSLLMVHKPEEEALFIPVNHPDEVRLKLPRFSTAFPFSRILELTELVTDRPVIEVVVALEEVKTLMLLAVLLLPIKLLLIVEGGEVLLINKPLKAVEAGEVPKLFISIPATWFAVTIPPVLEQLMPKAIDVFDVEVVEVVITTKLLTPSAPTIFPFPVELPPIFIPDPLVSIPVNTCEAGEVGMEEIEIAFTIFPFMFETGELLVVVKSIPS